MSNQSENNKRIAQNTIFLYFRTILIMIVSLYTSRVVLGTLGIEDYGVYNAVGGVVAMFAVITGALSNAISRYITFGIGQGNKEKLQVIFSTSVNIQFILSFIVLLVCEIGGIWFLNNKMNIPSDRMLAANWVLQCSLLTFVINLISVPYNACIIAHEHMNAYAYISIVDAILKLSVVYLLVISPVDKLIAYSVLLVIVSMIVRGLYGIYCGRHFEESHYHFIYDKKLSYEMLSFAGWNFCTNAASILNSQGVSILMNIYFGVLLNSARGIATLVDGAIGQFVSSFTTAINPQITKSYAQNNNSRTFFLVCKGAKFSYFLVFIFALPILLETNYVLELWLKNVPEKTDIFVRLTIIGLLVNTLGNSGYTACMATGKIKKYSIWITLTASCAFFGTLIAYSLGSPVEYSYVVYIVVYIIVLFVRLFLMKDMMGFPIAMYLKDVLGKIVIPSFTSIVLPVLFLQFLPQSFVRFIIISILAVLSSIINIYIIGLTKSERSTIVNKMQPLIRKIYGK